MKKPLFILGSAILIFIVSLTFIFSANQPEKNNTTLKSGKAVTSPTELKNNCKTDSNCYLITLTYDMNDLGISKTLKIMNETAKITNGFNNDCHNIAHRLGEKAYLLYGVKALETHENSCDWGFGHGVMVVASINLPASDFNKYFSNYCASDKDQIGCLHGLGHSLGTKKVTGSVASTVCKSLSKTYDATQVGIRKMVNKSGYGVCLEGWVMQRLGEPIWGKPISLANVETFCKGVEKGEGMEVCLGMGMRNSVDYVQDFKSRSERLGYFVKFCGNEGKYMKYECGRYLGEAADDVYVSGFKYDTKAVAAGMTRSCNSNYMEVCIESFTNFQLNRNNHDPKNILSSCMLLDVGRKNVCIRFLKDLNLV